MFRQLAVSTSVMSMVSVFRLLAQFFVVPVLSRILSPHDYGIVAMAMPFILFTMYFSDAGIGQSLVRASDDDRRVWSTSFWLTLLLGLSLGGLIAAVAPLGVWFFGEPRLYAIILALAAVMPFQAGSTIPEAWLRKKQKFGVIATTEMASIGIGIAAALTVAFKGGGAWALVAQQLALYGARFVLTFWFSGFRPAFLFHARGMLEHLVFGRDVLAATLVGFFTYSMDNIVVGKILGTTALGLYSMAFMFARLPGRIISGPLQYVIYAALVPHRENIPLLRQMLLFLTRALSAVIIPGMMMIAVAWEPVFRLLLSEKWLASGNLFMMAAPAAAFATVTGLRGAFMLIIGAPGTQLRSNTEYLAVLLALLICFSWFGTAWAVAGYSLSVILYFPRGMALILPRLDCTLGAFTRTMAVPGAVSVIFALLYRDLETLLPPGDWVRLLLGGAMGVVAIAISGFLQIAPFRREIALLKAAHGGGTT